ncbi:transcriptional regulator [Klebsiella michiganensis]|nr:transcriptional regulator [Klebsiella michiganensis]PNO41501.1 transcriptional regulator [Klebsiella michiganensis]TWW04720.1 transcriptional regulator [Klebsiella sp. ME-303]
MSPHSHFDTKRSHIDYFNYCHFDINRFNKKHKTLKIQLIKKLARNLI